ncbi:MAG TPA: dephospho-CoA kinase, partial [Candidatus Limnocylindrales bacterium]|nr:dephospho-CoA kinase [Candidatus Limnocylindrales bacterium]
DSLSHQAMAPCAPAYAPVVDMFGKIVLNDDGTVNRAMLGSIVFAHPRALARLEAITHPVVRQAALALAARAKQRVIVIEAIKLLESPLVKVCDTIWVVHATPDTQLRRLLEKRKLTEDEARRRIAAQSPQADKLARANIVVANDGSVEDTWRQVQIAWSGVQRAAGTAAPPPQQRSVPVQEQAEPVISELRKTAPLSGSGAPTLNLVVRRGMPGSADQIAAFISRMVGEPIDRMTVMLAFGQKSYLLADDGNDHLIGLAGWQVENLITRVDELYIDPAVPRDQVVEALAGAVEEASRELQSEVAFVLLNANVPGDVIEALRSAGYGPLRIEDIKFPAWREAARELLNLEGIGLMKQLRADRVLKPI